MAGNQRVWRWMATLNQIADECYSLDIAGIKRNLRKRKHSDYERRRHNHLAASVDRNAIRHALVAGAAGIGFFFG